MKTKEIVDVLLDAGFSEVQMSKHRFFYKNDVKVKLPYGTGTVPWAVSALKTLLRRANRGIVPLKPRLKYEEATVGRAVRSRIDFVDVPKGTKGVIDEDYGSGVMVKWILPHRLVPLRDGFSKTDELIFLELA